MRKFLNFRKKFLKFLFSKHFVDFLAGDVHSEPIQKKEMEKCKKIIVKLSSVSYYNKLTYENAKIIINGGQI